MTDKPVPSATKSEFLQQHADAWRDLQSLIAGFDAEQMVVPADAAGWNVRDHLAHLCAWQMTRLAFLEKEFHWDAFGISKEEFVSNDIDTVNATVREMTRNVSPNDVIDMLDESTEALRKRVLATDEELLLTPASEFHPDWMGLIPNARVLDVIWAGSIRHFNEHRPYIERIVES